MNATEKSGGGWLKIVLGLSLAANLFFIGQFAGALFGGKPDRRDAVPNSFLSSLSDERADEVKSFFKGLSDDRKASRRETRGAWTKVREAMMADPYDRDALEVAMQNIVDARADNSKLRYAKLVDFVSTMTTEERVAYSDAMREKYKRRRERRERREGN